MANTRIKDITGTETEFLADDYLAIDGPAEGTRKMLLDDLETQIRNSASDAQMAVVAALTANAAELNILDGCIATYDELNYLAGLTPGSSSANKAVVLDSNEDGEIGRNLDVGGTLSVTGITTLAGNVIANLITLGDNLDINGNDLIFDTDGNSKLFEKDNDVLAITLGGTEEYRFDNVAFGCATEGGANLGGTIGLGSATDANAWLSLYLTGQIYMKECATPADPATDGSCILWMDSSSHDFKIKLRSGGTTKTGTIADWSELV